MCEEKIVKSRWYNEYRCANKNCRAVIVRYLSYDPCPACGHLRAPLAYDTVHAARLVSTYKIVPAPWWQFWRKASEVLVRSHVEYRSAKDNDEFLALDEEATEVPEASETDIDVDYRDVIKYGFEKAKRMAAARNKNT